MKKVYTAVLLLAFSMVAGNAFAGVTVYMKVIGTTAQGQINGESNAINFVNWIEVRSIGVSSEIPINLGSTGAPTGKASLQPYQFEVPLNSASLPMLQDLYAGRALQSVDIWYVKTGSPAACNCAFYKVHLENVYVSKLTEALMAGDDNVSQQFSFVPAKFAWAYYKQAINGSYPTTPTNKFGWDITLNAAYNYSF